MCHHSQWNSCLSHRCWEKERPGLGKEVQDCQWNRSRLTIPPWRFSTEDSSPWPQSEQYTTWFGLQSQNFWFRPSKDIRRGSIRRCNSSYRRHIVSMSGIFLWENNKAKSGSEVLFLSQWIHGAGICHARSVFHQVGRVQLWRLGLRDRHWEKKQRLV
jgi:hypothetical protein